MMVARSTPSLAPWGWGALVVGVAAAAACAVGYMSAPAMLVRSYLVGYLLCLGISLGSLALLMLHNLTGGAWGAAIRRILEAATATLPLLALLFVPVALGMPELYVWARPGAASADPLLASKSIYLNVDAFLLRAIVYFAIWLLLSSLLNRWSARTQPGNIGRSYRRQQLISGPGLMLYGLTVTFASVDWAMSIDPHWYSSMYGVLFIAGQAVSAISFATLVLIGMGGNSSQSANADDLAPRRLDLGNLLLTFVMFWTYVAFMQYLIVWSGNLPEETPWYLVRSTGGWHVVVVALMAFHFAVPFLLLLSASVKQSPRRLALVAGLLLLMRFVDLFWLIMPTYVEKFSVHWLNVAAPVAVIGVWLAFYVWQLSRRLRLPDHGLYSLNAHDERHTQHAH